MSNPKFYINLDSDEDGSDLDDFGQPVKGRNVLRLATSFGQNSGILATAHTQPVTNPIPSTSRKQQKSIQFWNRQKQETPVQNPSTIPGNDLFFQHIKQRNMGLGRGTLSSLTSSISSLEVFERPSPLKTGGRNIGSPSTLMSQGSRGRGIFGTVPSKFMQMERGRGTDDPDLTNHTSVIDMNSNSDDRLPIFVDSQKGFASMMQYLKKWKEMAFDLEGHQLHSYLGYTALIQVGVEDAEYIIDPFPLFANIQSELKLLLEDRTILKVIFAAENEISWLQRDFEINLDGIIDIQKLYMIVNNLKELPSLKKAATEMFPGLLMDKKETCSDWRRRPLTTSMLKYAQQDVKVLLRIWQKLMVTDEEMDRAMKISKDLTLKKFPGRKYMSPFEEFAAVNKKRVKGPKPLSPLKLDEHCLGKYEMLHQWRNRYAQIIDESPENILGIEYLIELCHLSEDTAEDTIKNILKRGSKINFSDIHRQSHTIMRIFEEKDEFITRLNTIICHNCLHPGHVAPHCPFPKAARPAKLQWQVDPKTKTRWNKKRKQNKKANKEKLEGKS